MKRRVTVSIDDVLPSDTSWKPCPPAGLRYFPRVMAIRQGTWFPFLAESSFFGRSAWLGDGTSC